MDLILKGMKEKVTIKEVHLFILISYYLSWGFEKDKDSLNLWKITKDNSTDWLQDKHNCKNCKDGLKRVRSTLNILKKPSLLPISLFEEIIMDPSRFTLELERRNSICLKVFNFLSKEKTNWETIPWWLIKIKMKKNSLMSLI